MEAISDIPFPLLGLLIIGALVFVAWIAWRAEMKPQPPPDGDHWQRPKPWKPPDEKSG